MSDAQKHTGRRFRFSLLSIFAMLTLIGIAAAWFTIEWRIVQGREDVIHTAVRIGRERGYGEFGRVIDSPEQMSWIRRALGDEPVSSIWIDDRMPEGIVAQLRSAFPEAIINKRIDMDASTFSTAVPEGQSP